MDLVLELKTKKEQLSALTVSISMLVSTKKTSSERRRGEKLKESSRSRREGRVSQAERLPSATRTDRKRPLHADWREHLEVEGGLESVNPEQASGLEP